MMDHKVRLCYNYAVHIYLFLLLYYAHGSENCSDSLPKGHTLAQYYGITALE